jgi:transposase
MTTGGEAEEVFEVSDQARGITLGELLVDERADEWALVAPYLALMTEDTPQRRYPLREVFNGLRLVICGASSWRIMRRHFPPHSVGRTKFRSATVNAAVQLLTTFSLGITARRL